MKREIVVGIDPSFTGTGVSIIFPDHIKFYKISYKLGVKTFKSVSTAARLIASQIVHILPNEIDKVIMETPPPNSQFSAGLYALDTHIFNEITNVFNKEPLILPPSYIGHIHGTRRYPKSQSKELAYELLEKINLPYSVTLIDISANTEKKSSVVNADISESFLMALSLIQQTNPFTEIDKKSYTTLTNTKISKYQ